MATENILSGLAVSCGLDGRPSTTKKTKFTPVGEGGSGR